MSLIENVESLLMHQMAFPHSAGIQPDIVLVKHGESWGVAVVVDGWYARESDAQGVLDDVWGPKLHEVAQNLSRRVGV